MYFPCDKEFFKNQRGTSFGSGRAEVHQNAILEESPFRGKVTIIYERASGALFLTQCPSCRSAAGFGGNPAREGSAGRGGHSALDFEGASCSLRCQGRVFSTTEGGVVRSRRCWFVTGERAPKSEAYKHTFLNVAFSLLTSRRLLLFPGSQYCVLPSTGRRQTAAHFRH